jgi:hypothetical protein
MNLRPPSPEGAETLRLFGCFIGLSHDASLPTRAARDREVHDGSVGSIMRDRA